MNCVIETHNTPGRVDHPTTQGLLYRYYSRAYYSGTGSAYAVDASTITPNVLRAVTSVTKPAGVGALFSQHNFIGVDRYSKHR